eukprot:3983155-Amphidinium_carterae.1
MLAAFVSIPQPEEIVADVLEPMETIDPSGRHGTRPRAQDDETAASEEPPHRRVRVEDRDGTHPYRGTSTPLPSREPRPSSSWTGFQRQEHVHTTIQKGTVQVSTLSPALQELFLKGSRLKESRAVKETLTPLRSSLECDDRRRAVP